MQQLDDCSCTCESDPINFFPRSSPRAFHGPAGASWPAQRFCLPGSYKVSTLSSVCRSGRTYCRCNALTTELKLYSFRLCCCAAASALRRERSDFVGSCAGWLIGPIVPSGPFSRPFWTTPQPHSSLPPHPPPASSSLPPPSTDDQREDFFSSLMSPRGSRRCRIYREAGSRKRQVCIERYRVLVDNNKTNISERVASLGEFDRELDLWEFDWELDLSGWVWLRFGFAHSKSDNQPVEGECKRPI